MSSSVDLEWERRLGKGASMLLRRRRRARKVAPTVVVLGIGLGAAGAGLAASTGTGPVGRAVGLGVSAFFLSAVVLLLVGIAFGLESRHMRFLSEGAALSVLLPSNVGLTAAELSPHLKSPEVFDDWVKQATIAPAVMGAKLPQWAWVPGHTRRVISGTSAFALRSASFVVCVAATLSCVVFAAVLAFDRNPDLSFQWIGGSFVVALVVTSGIIRVASEARASTEYTAVYSTLTPIATLSTVRRSARWQKPDVRLGVDLVDPRTGAVLRAAGARSFTTKECARRRALCADANRARS